MKQKVQAMLDQLDVDLDSLVKRLSTVSEANLKKQPEENAWSVLQVMHHLMTAEQLSQVYLEKKLKGMPNIKKAGLGAALRSAGLQVFLRSPFKFKAPNAVNKELPADLNFTELTENWKKQRAGLKSFLESIPEEGFRKEAFKHALGGRMRIDHMLGFFDTHFKRHEKQIDRILS